MTSVKVLLWELLFRFPSRLVGVLFQSQVFMRMLFRGGGFTGANNLDKELANYLCDIDRGFFIEIGGNDGISQSNTKYLELFRGWRGLLVEPEPENFRRMSITRARDTHKFRAACVNFLYEMDEVELSSGDLMSVSLSLEVDLENKASHIAESQKYLKRPPKSPVYRAPARTLDSLLEEAGAPNDIDFFSLDVEGAELAVLGGLSLKNWNITFILVESRSPLDLERYMKKYGYALIGKLTVHDYLFQRVKH